MNRVHLTKYLLSLCLLLTAVFLASSCSDSNDRGDGFEVTKTTEVRHTTPSSTANLDQPCSLVSKVQAGELLQVPLAKVEEPESSQPDSGTLRCRYAATSDDGKLYLVLNTYIYKSQTDYDLVRSAHKGEDISTTLDNGFYYQIETTRQSEHFVAAQESNRRIGISASIAVIDGEDSLQDFEFVLPDTSTLAGQLGKIHGEINDREKE